MVNRTIRQDFSLSGVLSSTASSQFLAKPRPLTSRLLPKVIAQRILLRTLLHRLPPLLLLPVPLRRIRFLPNLHQRHEFLELLHRHDPPTRFLVAPREALAHSLCEIRGVELGDGFEGGDDVDGGIAVAGAAGDAAGEVDHVGEVAAVCHEDDFEFGGFEVVGLVYGGESCCLTTMLDDFRRVGS